MRLPMTRAERHDAAALEAAKRSVSLADLIRASGVVLKRTGKDRYAALCPFHADRSPSFTVWDGGTRPHYHCFACGTHGDVLDFLRRHDGLSFRDAVKVLMGNASSYTPKVAAPMVDDAPDIDESQRRTFTAEIWRTTIKPETVLRRYWREARGLLLPIPKVVRFNASAPYGYPKPGKPAPSRFPAMVAVIQGPDGAATGVHVTFLSDDGSGKRADLPKDRLMYGLSAKGAVRLAAPVAGQWLIVGEGIESVLSAMQAMQLPGWAALSTSGLRGLVLPSEVKRVVIAADNDSNGAGETAAKAAADRWVTEGRRVFIAKPIEPETDFNDLVVRGGDYA